MTPNSLPMPTMARHSQWVFTCQAHATSLDRRPIMTLKPRVAPEAYFANKIRFARATNQKLSFEIMAVPRVVPQHSDFNNLQCQTSLTALTGAIGIFLCCQTGKFTTANCAHS